MQNHNMDEVFPPAPLFDTDSSEYGRPETGEWAEQEERCHFCGEPFDPQRPNAGDGWAEMCKPTEDTREWESVVGHYSCGTSRGWELA